MDTCRQQPGSQAREINFLWSRVAQGVMPRQMMADHFPDLDDFRFAERDIARRAITPEIDTKPSLGQFLAWLIRPAGCTLGGTVNVSSLIGLPLPERPGQQRNHLTRLVRSCRGRNRCAIFAMPRLWRKACANPSPPRPSTSATAKAWSWSPGCWVLPTGTPCQPCCRPTGATRRLRWRHVKPERQATRSFRSET